MSPQPRTMVDLLRGRAEATPDAPALTFLEGDDGVTTWTYAELDHRARVVAAAVQARTRPGDRVLLLHPQGLEYVAALFGCMYAGVLAVPLQPPGRHRAAHALPKLEAIVADGGVALAGTVAGMVDEMRLVVAQSPALAEMPWLATDRLPGDGARAWSPLHVGPEDLAYLQYTSGSTSTPKGVMVSHANLLYNLRTFDLDYGHDDASVMVSWLPTFHDLGLVYGVFMPLYGGFRGVLLDPLDFLRRPIRWLQAIDRFRGTHAPAPNFAFDLVATKSTPEERAALDLSCWRVALNGAEPIRWESEARFVEAFGPAGVTWRTISHAYGMSEATAVIAKEPVGTLPVFLDVDGAALERHEVVPLGEGAPGARRVAGCGVPVMDTIVRAVDPESLATLPDDRVGELWVGGPTRAQGYWRRPADTEEGFLARTSDRGEGPFLRTGDLGFLHDGQVYVTGRLKDLIIVRGENHYPQDIEWDVQNAHPAIRPSCVAAFSLDRGPTEGVGIVAELTGTVADPEPVFAAVREAVAEHGLSARVVALVAARSIFKTSSGKIMRRRTREALFDGTLEEVARWEAAEPAPEAPAAADLPARLAEATPLERRELLVAHVLARTAGLLGLDDAGVLDADVPLRDLGLDSVQVVDLSERLSKDLGVELPATALFDHPTADALARHLADEALPPPSSTVGTTAAAPPPIPDGASDEELARLLAEELEDL